MLAILNAAVPVVGRAFRHALNPMRSRHVLLRRQISVSLQAMVNACHLALSCARHRAAHPKVKLNAVRFLSSTIKNREIELKGEGKLLTQEDAMVVAQKLIKQTKQAIDDFLGAGRSELAAEEQAKVQVWEAYLPAQMSRAEVDAIVAAVVEELKPASPKAMGAVMKAVMAKVAGQADNKMVSDAVKAKMQA